MFGVIKGSLSDGGSTASGVRGHGLPDFSGVVMVNEDDADLSSFCFEWARKSGQGRRLQKERIGILRKDTFTFNAWKRCS